MCFALIAASAGGECFSGTCRTRVAFKVIVFLKASNATLHTLLVAKKVSGVTTVAQIGTMLCAFCSGLGHTTVALAYLLALVVDGITLVT